MSELFFYQLLLLPLLPLRSIAITVAGVGREEDKEHAKLHAEIGGDRASRSANNRPVSGRYRESGERGEREGGHTFGYREIQERFHASL